MSIDKKKELKENNLVESPISSEDANMTEEEKEELAKNRKQSDSGNETQVYDNSDSMSNSDMDESDYDDLDFVEEEEVEEAGTFQKVKRVEVDDLEKVYKESIQKGDLHKYKLEKIPRLRRNDINIMNRLNKEINTISLLKHLATEKVEGDVNQVKILPPDYKPLLKSFDNNSDFENQLAYSNSIK